MISFKGCLLSFLSLEWEVKIWVTRGYLTVSLSDIHIKYSDWWKI